MREQFKKTENYVNKTAPIFLSNMNQEKSKGVAYLLLFFFGFFGGHKFYLEKYGLGILYFFTGGLLGIGLFIDLFTLSGEVDSYNTRMMMYSEMLRRPKSNNSPITNSNSVVVNVQKEEQASSNIDKLHKLAELKDKGILTDVEFIIEKEKILSII